jgi:microcompartment protein CcmL/EutN
MKAPATVKPPAGPALGLLEIASIARGVVVADAMVKRAAVDLLWSRPVSPGKHLVAVWGEVAEVDEAMGAGLLAAGDKLVDRLFLPQAHAQLGQVLPGERRAVTIGALAVVETATVAATVVAADAAAKAAEIELVEMRLAMGLGGKAFFTLTGELDQVEAARAAAEAAIDPTALIATELIPAPHDDLVRKGVVF